MFVSRIQALGPSRVYRQVLAGDVEFLRLLICFTCKEPDVACFLTTLTVAPTTVIPVPNSLIEEFAFDLTYVEKSLWANCFGRRCWL